MMQIVNGINFHPGSRDRRTDLGNARGVLIDVFNSMRAEIKDHYLGNAGPGDPETQFLFGGFSWRAQEFLIWTLHYDLAADRFTFRPATAWAGQVAGEPRRKLIAWIGDEAAVHDAKKSLISRLREAGKLDSGGFDMEPFEVLRDVIREGAFDSIGGAPQVAKVYRSLQTQYFSVRWPDVEGSLHAVGRRALSYEQFFLPEIDPDRPGVHSHTARVRNKGAGIDIE
ncbi:hypothetical protein [Nocardia fluminea]|uniref:hypothetical protein n=1 Tax=Nocardia fluminea TaxID=134984 RepID=UPI00341479A0